MHGFTDSIRFLIDIDIDIDIDVDIGKYDMARTTCLGPQVQSAVLAVAAYSL